MGDGNEVAGGTGWADLLPELAWLSGFAAVLLPLAVALYRKRTA